MKKVIVTVLALGIFALLCGFNLRKVHSGGEIGSVSAASSAFSAYIGKQFKRVANTLTIG